MIPVDSQLGIILEYRVIKPSRNPAAKVKGKVLIKILMPVFCTLFK